MQCELGEVPWNVLTLLATPLPESAALLRESLVLQDVVPHVAFSDAPGEIAFAWGDALALARSGGLQDVGVLPTARIRGPFGFASRAGPIPKGDPSVPFSTPSTLDGGIHSIEQYHKGQ